MDRLQKKRDQQARIDARTRLIEQIDSCMHAGDYGRVFELLQGAAAEFPNDEELNELEKLAQQGVERATEAQRLMAEGQELCAKQNAAEGIQLLRRAYELEEHNPVARAVLANTLVEHAQTLVETDWREAERLSKEAFDLNPSHPMAKTLRSLIQDQKRESYVSECVAQARKLQAAGDLAAAIARVQEGLALYPREMRFVQIRDAVQRDQQAQRRQTRRRDLDELRRLEAEAHSAADVAIQQTLGAQARALAEKYPGDAEVLSGVNSLLQKLSLPGIGSEAVSHTRECEQATLSFAQAPTSPSTPQAPMKSKPSVEAPKATPSPQSAAATAKDNSKSKSRPTAVSAWLSPTWNFVLALKRARALSPKMLAAAWAVVVIVLAIAVFRRHPKPVAAPAPPPQPIAAQPVAPPPEPQLPTLKLSSDTTTGKVIFDDQPPVDLQNAEWALEKIPTGEHTLKFEGPSGGFSATFTAADGALPVIHLPITAKGVFAAVVTGMGSRLHIDTSQAGIKASLDGQEPLEVPAEGADFSSVSAGSHELALSYSGEQYKLAIEAGPAPALAVFAESGQNVGSLVVVTGQDKARVFLNGKPLEQLTEGGKLRIANLEPREYTVRVAKAGFQDVPEQKIRIRKGEQGRLVFGLLALPHLATLSIQNAPPGATVLVDQVPAGTVQADGTLTLATVTPGDHVIELRKDRFKPRQLHKYFVAGAAVALAASETALEAAPGEVRINFAPADAQVTLARTGEVPVKVVNGTQLSLFAGTYTLSAHTADGVVRTSALELAAGQTRNLDLSLAPDGMAKWLDPSGWKQESGVFTRKGGDYVLYNAAPAGTFVFSAMLNKGHRLQWVVHYTDANNYDLFQIDDNNFYRTEIRNGVKTAELKIPHKGDKKSFRTLQIRVTPGEIVHSIKTGEAWFVLDRWSLAGSDLSGGRFGFYIPGGDQVSLSSFAHYPDLNLK